MLSVVVAVIENDDGKILIAQRPQHLDQGGLWEFPGGKVEVGETAYQALCREIKEEINIDIIQAQPLMVYKQSHVSKLIQLDVWVVEKYFGVASGNEGQLIRWVCKEDLVKYPMPEGNEKIIEVFGLNATTA